MKRFFALLICTLLSCSPAYALQKNAASQKWTVFAFNSTTNAPVTGDAANITGTIYIDGSSNTIDDTNPTEIAGGYYEFDLAQAETNGNHLTIVAASGTSNVVVLGKPSTVYTVPPGWNTLSIASGVASSNVTQWLGSAAATPTVAGVPEVDVTHWIGTAAATPTVAGVPEVDITHLGGSGTAGSTLKTMFDGTKIGIDAVFNNATSASDAAAATKTAMEADGGKLDHLWEMTEDDTGTRRYTTKALEQAPTGTGSGLTAQQTRDAMKLAPSTGAADAGSLDALIAAANTTLGTPAGASVSADIAAVKSQTAAIETDTQGLQTQIGTDGAGLTALGDTRLANLDATVSSRSSHDAAAVKTAMEAAGSSIAGIKAKTDTIPTNPVSTSDLPPSFSTVTVTDGKIASSASVTLTTEDIQTIASAAQPQSLPTTVAAGTHTASSFVLATGPTGDGYFGQRYWFATVIDATTGIPGGSIIDTYTGSTKAVSLETALPFIPEAGDKVYITPLAGQAKWSR